MFSPTWLENEPTAILEIGPGTGWLAIEMARRWPGAMLYLMDGDGTAEKRVGYRADTQAWNSRYEAADNVLKAVPGATVVTVPPDNQQSFHPLDLVVSLQSWCYHYPVGTYLSLVKRSLKPRGRVIVDHRRNLPEAANGPALMEASGFCAIAVIDESYKWWRVVWERCE